MIRRFGLLLLTLPSTAALTAVAAQAQPYPGSPPSYYRGSPPPVVYEDRLPPPAYGAPSRILPYPADEADAAPPPPGFATPDGRPPYGGHQLDPQPQAAGTPPAARGDADVIRPPAGIGPAPQQAPRSTTSALPSSVTAALPPEDQPEVGQPKELPPNLKKQLVNYQTKEPAGTVIIDTPNTYLYLVLGGGKAMRYGIGVGREGFTWAGTERISKMSEWPDWHPPAEMIERQPYLPRFMAGGPGNPLGARALYLGKTLYRIHGTNQPSTIGQTVSSGCIRLINEDVEDLFNRVQVGSRVVVLPGNPQDTMASGILPEEERANPATRSSRSGATISGSPLPPVR